MTPANPTAQRIQKKTPSIKEFVNLTQKRLNQHAYLRPCPATLKKLAIKF